THRKNEELREVVRLMPEERLLLETDAPYLAPQAMRGSKNEPANLIEAAKTIAREREMGLDKLEKITTQNAVKLFRRMQI
ncbi:MAG: Hydrolase, TatD family, partial [Candidatus Amesbacteria bacterium GW2011_GWA1_48_9]